MITPPDPLRRSHLDLTPDTNVKMSMVKLIGFVGSVVVVVATAVAAYVTITTKLNLHIADTDIHLDKEYMRDHGRPVGKWDVQAERDEFKQRMDDQAKELKLIHDLMIEIRQQQHGRH